MTFFEIIERVVHGRTAYRPHAEVDIKILDALEWSDTDSGEDLVDRADEIEEARPATV